MAPLGSLCKTSSGGTPAKSRKEYYEGGHIPWLLSGEVAQGEIRAASNFITAAGLQNSSAKVFPTDTVLVAMYGATAGQVGILKIAAASNQAVCGILPSDQFVPEYLFYFFLSKKDELVGKAAGNAQPNISQAKIRETMVPIVCKTEQRRIVAILDEAFEAIATAKANTERNLQNAREVFESELHRLFTQNEADWSKKTLREVAVDFGRGKSKHRPRNDPRLYGGPYPFIQTGDVRNAGHHITEYTQTYSDVGLAQSKLWPKGTLCITIAANIAETGVLNFEACFPDSVIGVVVDERQTTSKYLEYMLQTVKADLKAKGKGSAQDNINMATFETERFPFPDLNEQIKIVSRLDRLVEDVDRLATTYTTKLAALDELKQSLLHQTFSGHLLGHKDEATVKNHAALAAL